MTTDEQREPVNGAFDEDREMLGEDRDALFEQAESPGSVLPRSLPRSLLQAQAALLDNAILYVQTNPETYRLVRTHFTVLEQWHIQHTGWRIQRSSSFFRLERHLHMIAPVYLDDKLKRARDFACLLWLLWFAEKRYLAGGGRNQQFLLSQLADELQQEAQLAGNGALDFRNQHDRYSMWRALDYLTRLGALQTLEGEVKRWAEDADQPDSEVLYEFTPGAHSLIEALNEKRLATITSLLGATNRLLPGALPLLADEVPPLIRAWRVLLLGPALFRFDDPAAFAALVAQAEQVSNELAEAFGWFLELNSDYACIVRGGGLSIGAGPTLALNGAYDHMVLLLCSAFRQRVEEGLWSPDTYGCLSTTHWDIIPLFSDLRQRYGTYWGATVQQTKATDLLEEIYLRMRQFGLLRGPDAAGNILILPTAARYSVNYTQEPSGVRRQ
jgi:uncharacterized protein (TIGR02678 family)